MIKIGVLRGYRWTISAVQTTQKPDDNNNWDWNPNQPEKQTTGHSDLQPIRRVDNVRASKQFPLYFLPDASVCSKASDQAVGNF